MKEFFWALSMAGGRFVHSLVFAAHELPFQDSCPGQGRSRRWPRRFFDSVGRNSAGPGVITACRPER